MASDKKNTSRSLKGRIFSALLLLAIGIAIGIWVSSPSGRQRLQSFADKTRTTLQSFVLKIKESKIVPASEPELPIIGPTAPPQQSVITAQTDYDHLKLGVPGKADKIVDRPGYALGYIEYHEQPAWVVYHLTKKMALTKAAARNDDFKEDPAIPTKSATLADYRGSGYDRGHLCPAADMRYSMRTMADSFYMSNMSPQRPEFNRGIWKNLESQVRNFAIAEEDVYIVTGPILPAKKSVTIGNSKVTVPTHYYKVVYDRTPPEKMIGFILPNAESKKPLQEFAVTVDAVEQVTGLNFFSTVPQPQQEELEKTISVDAWKWD